MNNRQIARYIARLVDWHGNLRWNVVDALCEIGAPAVPALIAMLQNKRNSARRHVPAVLAAIGDVSAVPALIEALQDSYVRRWAAEALGSIGDASAVPALVEVLKDEDDYDRRIAAISLGYIGDISAMPALIQALEDENGSVRSQAAFALGKLDGPAVPAVPYLIKALEDEEVTVRMEAAGALGHIGDVAAVPALRKALLDPTVVCMDAAIALGQIGDIVAVSLLLNAVNSNRTFCKAALALKNLGDAHTLPRRILACSQFTAQERIALLDALRRVDCRLDYSDEANTLSYTFPDIRTLCEAVLDEEDTDARIGAQTVIDWLTIYHPEI